MEVNKRQPGGIDAVRKHAAPKPGRADGKQQHAQEPQVEPKPGAEQERAQIAHRNAVDRAQLAQREEVDQAQAARRAEIDRYQAAQRAAVDKSQSGSKPSHVSDELQLSHSGESESTSPAREARLQALTEAFREGSLNTPERMSLAAEKILQG